MSQDAPPEPAPAEPSAAPSTSRRLLGIVGVLVLAGGLVLIQGCSGTRPANLGVTDGRLQPPPSSPNCVSSQADPGDAEHYVEPLTYTGPLPAARERLLRVLAELDLEVIERGALPLGLAARPLGLRGQPRADRSRPGGVRRVAGW